MLFYETFGSDSLTPLVFLHGFLGSRLDWIPLIESLSQDYHCIALDLPAHGKSKASQDVQQEVETTLLSLSKESPILIGYSLGGRLALSYGQEHPEKIKGMIVISSHIGLQTDEEKKKRKAQDLLWQERLKTLSPQEFLTLWYQQPVFASLQKRPDLLQELLQKRSYQNPLKLTEFLLQVTLSKQPFYNTFKHPIYYLFGEEDTLYSNLYASLPSAQKRKIEKAGHAVHIENPEDSLKAIRDVLRVLEGSFLRIH